MFNVHKDPGYINNHNKSAQSGALTFPLLNLTRTVVGLQLINSLLKPIDCVIN